MPSGFQGHKHTEEAKQKTGMASRKNWEDLEYRKKYLRAKAEHKKEIRMD